MNNRVIRELRRMIINLKQKGHSFYEDIYIGYIRCLRDIGVINFTVYFKLKNAMDHICYKYISEVN